MSVHSCSVIASLGSVLGLAAALLVGGTASVLAQSGEFGDVIFLDDVPGFVGDQEADSIIACLPDGTCVTADGNVLAGFRPAVWPDLRLVDDDLVIESDVQVQATAFGRIIARTGINAETFASGPGHPIDSGTGEGNPTVAITPPLHIEWAPNNFDGSAAVWISYADTGINGPSAAPFNTTFTVSESFSVPLGMTGDIDGFVFADDTARVVVIQDGDPVDTPVFEFNDSQDICADGPIGCEDPDDKGDLSLGDSAWQTAGPPLNLNALPPGDYTLEFTARQDSDVEDPEANPFGLMYAFDVILDPPTVADFCWTFDGGIPGEKVCVSIAECDDCLSPPDQCPIDDAKITLTSGPDGDAICNDIAQQFVDKGATETLEEFQFIVGLDVPDTSEPGSVRVATCTITEPVEEQATYVPLCRNPASKVVEAIVNNDIPVFAFETPRCVKMGGRTYC